MRFYHIALNKEIEEIYASYSLYSFAKAMISIFVPIYLLTTGHTLETVILFYLVYYGLLGVLTLPAAFFVKKKGAKHCIFRAPSTVPWSATAMQLIPSS